MISNQNAQISNKPCVFVVANERIEMYINLLENVYKRDYDIIPEILGRWEMFNFSTL